MELPRILTEPISRAELGAIAERRHGDLVKCVVDVERRRLALGAESEAVRASIRQIVAEWIR